MLASNQAISEHETSTYGLQLPTQPQTTTADRTDCGDDREVFEYPDQHLRGAPFLEANLGTLQDEEQMGTFCNSPNLLEFNGMTTSGVSVPVLTDPFTDAPPPGDFESRSNWNFAMREPGILAAPSAYRNRTSAPPADFSMSFSVESNHGQGYFARS